MCVFLSIFTFYRSVRSWLLILLASGLQIKLITKPHTGAVSESILFGLKYKKHKKNKLKAPS